MKDRIKVLHISKYYPPYVGGLESFCHDIVTALDTTGEYEQFVFCYNNTNETVNEVFDGINVFRIGIQKIIASQPIAKGYGKKIKKVIDEFKPDIIHFLYPNPYAAHYFLKCQYHGIIHLDWICDIIKQKYIRCLFTHQNKTLLKRASFVTSITPSYFENTDYLPKYKGSKDFIACRIGDSRMTVTDDQKNKAKKIRDQFPNKKIVFFFGRHTEYKGLEYLIQSNYYLDKEKIVIIIAGQGELTKELMHRAKVFENINFVGKLSDSDVNSYLLACDIFAFPSITRNEAFGISLAEAMYFGKPTVTFTIPGSGVNWVSKDKITGLEAPNKDVIQFAKNITRLADDQELYLSLSKNAKKRADDLFCKEKFDKKVIEVYRKMYKEVY